MSKIGRPARLSELRYLIRSWDDGFDRFPEIVDCAIRLSPNAQRDLARQFQVADSTVRRWITGVARPHLRMKGLIVEFLRREFLNS